MEKSDPVRDGDTPWLQRLLELARSICLDVDPDGTIRKSNRHADALLGGDGGDATGQVLADFGARDADRASIREALSKDPATEEMVVALRTSDSVMTATFSCEARRSGQRAVLIRDISKQVAAEAALKSSEERFRKVFYTSRDSISLTRAEDGMIVDVNNGFTRITGFGRDEVIGKTTLELGLWDEPMVRERILEQLRTQEYCDEITVRLRDAEGKGFWGSVSARLIIIEGTEYAVGVVRNIDDLKESQDALRASEAKFKAIFHHATSGMMIMEPTGEIIEANPVAKQLLRSSGQGDGSAHWSILLADQCRDEGVDKLRSTAKGETTNLEALLHVDGGHPRPVDIWLRKIEFDDRPRILAVFYDLTARYDMQARMLQSHRIEAVGILASGVAHDFNNLLTVIRGMSELVSLQLSEDSPIADNVAEIDKAAVRAAELTKQLLAFSQQQTLRPRRIDLRRVIEKLERLLHGLLPEDIELRIQQGVRLSEIRADEEQVELVITSLVVNARDAIAGRGTITVSTGTERREHRDFITVTVTDDGQGMTKAVQERVFEPFFTTKSQGRGAGLGLATVHGVVSQSQGFLDLESTPGVGSRLVVGFPAWLEETADIMLDSEFGGAV